MAMETGLQGPYRLERKTIDEVIDKILPGAYAVGIPDGERFNVRLVGRSDYDIGARIKEFLGFYPQFAFAYFDTARAAFEKECQLFHDYAPFALDSRLHPSRRAYSSWRCPRCGIFDY